MRKKVRKKYEKPGVIRISLDAKGVVLGFCKTDTGGTRGPGQIGNHCDPPLGCQAIGS